MQCSIVVILLFKLSIIDNLEREDKMFIADD